MERSHLDLITQKCVISVEMRVFGVQNIMKRKINENKHEKISDIFNPTLCIYP